MNRLRQIVYLTEVLAQPGGIRAFLNWKPFSITSCRIVTLLKKSGISYQTIIDGGANKGQFARAATELFPEAWVIAFEPLPDVAIQLRKNLGDRANVTVHEVALGPIDGSTTFHRTPYSLASSVLKPTGDPRDTESVTVPVVRLDSVLKGDDLKAPILLKLDLQGYELEALRGGPEILARADSVLLEVSFVRGYEREPLFVEVLDFMRAANFEFERPLDMLIGDDGAIIQMDALFRNSRQSNPVHVR